MQTLLISLTSQTVSAALVSVQDVAAETISSVKTYTDPKSLLIQTDKALQELGKESEQVDETIFALDYDWVTGGDISPDHQAQLQDLTDSLALKPQGFVVKSEALYQQAIQENQLVSKLFLEVRATELQLVVIQRGTLLGAVKVGRSNQLGADVIEALARFKDKIGADHFPSQLQLVSEELSTSQLNQLQQELLSGDWTSQIQFLHQPEVTVTDEHFLMHQLVAQAGQSILAEQGVVPNLPAVVPPEDAQPDTPDMAEATFSDPTKPDAEAAAASASHEFDFADFDQANLDLSDNLTAVEPAVAAPGPANPPPLVPPGEPHQVQVLPPTQPAKKTWLQTVKGWFMSESGSGATAQTGRANQSDHHPSGFHHTSLKKEISHHPFIALGVILGLVILAVGTAVYAQTQHRVVLSIKLATETVSTQTTIQLDPTATEPDADQRILPAQVTTVEVSGDDFVEASGVKLIGEQASGTVVLYNKTTSTKSFDAGTQLSTGSLTYTLDEEVQVASASVEEKDGGETKTFGSEEVTVTATEIGADSNLDAGTTLTVANFATSSYEAEVKDGLTGGSSREVQVVAEADMAELRQKLTDRLVAEAETQLRDQAEPGQYFVTTGQVEIVDATFDAEVGDEVQTLGLDLTISVEAFGYQTQDLKPLAEQVLLSEVPPGFTLSNQDPQILSSPVEDQPTETTPNQETVIKLEADISAQAVPELDLTALAQDVAGKPNPQALSAVQGNPAVESVEYGVHPALFERFYTQFPKSSDKIQITIQDQ